MFFEYTSLNPLKSSKLHLLTNSFSKNFEVYHDVLLGAVDVGKGENKDYILKRTVGVLDYCMLGIPVLISCASWYLYNQEHDSNNLVAYQIVLDVSAWLVELVNKLVYMAKWLISLPIMLVSLPFVALAHGVSHAIASPHLLMLDGVQFKSECWMSNRGIYTSFLDFLKRNSSFDVAQISEDEYELVRAPVLYPGHSKALLTADEYAAVCQLVSEDNIHFSDKRAPSA